MSEQGQSTSPRLRSALALAGVLWAAGIGYGMHRLWAYSFEPPAVDPAPPVWPRDSRLTPDASLPTLLMFIHPRCPCTRASLEELERLVRYARGTVAVTVCLFAPAQRPAGWEQTDLWRRAAGIPDALLHRDLDAVEARRFRASVSGTVLLYGTDGRLRFAGGITNGRGHGGDSVGRTAILEILASRPPASDRVRVFGCPIYTGPQPESSARPQGGPGGES